MPNPSTPPTGWSFIQTTDAEFGAGVAGGNFADVDSNGAIIYVQGIASDVDDYYVWYSTDGGSTFTKCATSIPIYTNGTSRPTVATPYPHFLRYYPADDVFFLAYKARATTSNHTYGHLVAFTFSGTDITVQDDLQLATYASSSFAYVQPRFTIYDVSGTTNIVVVQTAGATTIPLHRVTYSGGTLTGASSATIPGLVSDADSGAQPVQAWNTSQYNVDSSTTTATSDEWYVAGPDTNGHGFVEFYGTTPTFGTQSRDAANDTDYNSFWVGYSPVQSKFYYFSHTGASASTVYCVSATALDGTRTAIATPPGSSFWNLDQMTGRYDLTDDKFILYGWDSSSNDLVRYVYNCGSDTWDALTIEYDYSEEGSRPNRAGGITQNIAENGYIIARWQDDDTNAWSLIKSINAPPTTTITSPADGVTADIETELELTWTYNDPEGDTQASYSIRRIVDAVTTEYWNGTGWVSSESGSTVISGAATSVNFGTNWADPSSETTHEYSVKTNDGTSTGAWSTGVTIYPTTVVSTSRGFALPRPIKKQENIMSILKSNNDYMLSWVNNYVPKYGDLNDDLYLKAGIRPGGESQMRDMFPPVVGEFDLGNGTNYFNAVGATNIYRTNELTLSDARTKEIYGDMIFDGVEFLKSLPLKAYRYKDKRRNRDKTMRFGPTAQDVRKYLVRAGIDAGDQDITVTEKDEDGNDVLFLIENQLAYYHMQATKQLIARIEELETQIERLSRGSKNT